MSANVHAASLMALSHTLNFNGHFLIVSPSWDCWPLTFELRCSNQSAVIGAVQASCSAPPPSSIVDDITWVDTAGKALSPCVRRLFSWPTPSSSTSPWSRPVSSPLLEHPSRAGAEAPCRTHPSLLRLRGGEDHLKPRSEAKTQSQIKSSYIKLAQLCACLCRVALKVAHAASQTSLLFELAAAANVYRKAALVA